MLLGTVQLVARLHRTSVAGAVATDAVHRVAEAPPSSADDTRADATARIHAALGPDVTVIWGETPTGPEIEIRVPGSPLPGLATDIRRGATARSERSS